MADIEKGPMSPMAKLSGDQVPLEPAQLRTRGKRKNAKKTWKETMESVLNSKGFNALTMVFTIYALFADDIRVMTSLRPADQVFYAFSAIALAIFLVEFALNCLVKGDSYTLQFYFWLDFLSTISLIPDIGWVWDPLTGSGGGTDDVAALKAGRASRAGTKAGRIVRIVRLVRMVRIVKLYKATQKGDEEVEMEDMAREPSKVGKKLTELTTRRVIVLVLIMILMLPLLDGTLTSDNANQFQDQGLKELHQMASPFYNNSNNYVSDQIFKFKAIEYVRKSGRLMYLKVCGTHPFKQVLSSEPWITNMKFQKTITGAFEASVNPINGWDPSYDLRFATPAEIFTYYRSDEAEGVEVSSKYVFQNGLKYQSFDLSPGESMCVSQAIFDNKAATTNAALLNLVKTLVIMVVLTTAVMAFTNDAANLVIEPIERMMSTVTKLAENPLSTTTNRKNAAGLVAEKEGYETMLLEKTIKKIGGLLQVGFGAAGAEIISQNMGGDGELDAMVPGKLITSVFGFAIMSDFTETCMYLGKDITRYINTIALVVHNNAHSYYGAANKNIGSAFLLAWKICDGRLYGLKDPRDEDQSRLPDDKIRDGRADVNLGRMGRGKRPKILKINEYIDCAALSCIKSIYEVHRANQVGGAFHQFNHRLQEMAKTGGMHPDDSPTFENFHVHMGYGMHIGWAIEGAIGSKFKIDASYLSPNVNMSARLEAATHQFGTPFLVSEWVVNEMSEQARQYVRLVDRICVVGSKIPMKIYTIDIHNYSLPSILEPTFDSMGIQESINWHQHPDLVKMREGVDKDWRPTYDLGVNAYLEGDWAKAIEHLNNANRLNGADGPTKSLLKEMAARDNICPSDWKRPGEKQGFRQLTSK
jgi:class 3 adenylate cyclase